MLSSFIERFKAYHIVCNGVILGWYGFQLPRFESDDTEFLLINEGNLYIVYILFLKNEDKMINQIQKVQLMPGVLYLVGQMPLLYLVNIVSAWCYVHGYNMGIFGLNNCALCGYVSYVIRNVMGLS